MNESAPGPAPTLAPLPPAPEAAGPSGATRRARRLGPGAWVLAAPLALVAVGVLVPLGYLIARALQADPAEALALVFRARNARLLLNTTLLGAGVLALASAVALPLAWLAAQAEGRQRPLVLVAGVLPLAVPGLRDGDGAARRDRHGRAAFWVSSRCRARAATGAPRSRWA